MNLNALTIITDAMKTIGVLAKNETLSADEANDGLRALNVMLDSWSARKLLSLAGIEEPFPLIYNQASYTIGTGGNFNTTTPLAITSAFLRDGNNIDNPIEVVDKELYDSYGDKSFSRVRPTTIAFDPGSTQQAIRAGTIYVYPIPDNSTTYTLFITEQKMLTEFTSLTTTVTFPPSYTRALKYNLAVELYGDYFNESKVPIPPLTLALARESIRVLETVNAKRIPAAMDIPGRVSVFNIYTGDYST